MMKYDIPDTFINKAINYPFNITNMDGVFVTDFWSEIESIKTKINDERQSHVRFIWIDAESYCQTEVFIKKIFEAHQKDYPILYLHWIDYKASGRTIWDQLDVEEVDGCYFTGECDKLKICVIDHAEEISEKDHFLRLCRHFSKNKCIFIFLAKKDDADLSYWKQIITQARTTDDDDADSLLGIKRSETYYYQVRPYTYKQCSDILKATIHNIDVLKKSLSLISTIPHELRRPYNFDFFISELLRCTEVSEVPKSFDCPELINKIYSSSVKGVFAHLHGHNTFEDFIKGYYSSGFVQNYSYGEQSRLPHDNYAWAYGVIRYSQKPNSTYDTVISLQFDYKDIGQRIAPLEQIKEINKRIVTIYCSGELPESGDEFSVKDYFTHLANYSIIGAQICATVLFECFNQLDQSITESLFILLGTQYKKKLSNSNEIRPHLLLGLEIGKLLPKYGNTIIAKGLENVFDVVNDEYIVPKTNDDGISIIPVTNFEFIKFVLDNGYESYYRPQIQNDLYDIAAAYYREIFSFIIKALSGKDLKIGRYLAHLLKGYDWDQYRQTAYLLSRQKDIDDANIYESIKAYYPNAISHPAKWIDSSNSDVHRAFCNPLQPVVCVNLFEARAYATWLESKIGKPVRVFTYDPDYLSVIGTDDGKTASQQRKLLVQHINENKAYINSIENDVAFYGANDIEIKEPSPVALPNSLFCGIYDFIGNVFEVQNTPFVYNYGRDNVVIKQKLAENCIEVIDYNCAGGGLQRTAANWPPEYMGQVPAFLRNQDIGFRIVIGNKPIGLQEHRSKTFRRIDYSESKLETYSETTDNEVATKGAILLSNLSLSYGNSTKNAETIFTNEKVYYHDDKCVALFPHNGIGGKYYKEAILVVVKGDDVYAYHLTGIASVKTTKPLIPFDILMIVREPQISEDLTTRKRINNKASIEWIDMVQVSNLEYTDTYHAKTLSIANGYFRVSGNVRAYVIDGEERKTQSELSGIYKIGFKSERQVYRKQYYDYLAEKIDADFFLPDWVDIVDYIRFIADSMSKTSELDIEAVMAAITTIDTADLHEQINKKHIIDSRGERLLEDQA